MKFANRHLTVNLPHLLAAGLLFVSILLAYSNTFDAGWHLDDQPNILDNRSLHIRSLDPGTMLQTFSAAPNLENATRNRLYRPLACLSFALNWYFGQDSVFGYHVVNLLVHFLTACFLYLCIRQILATSLLADKYRGKEIFIALLAALLWALNPVQTQAVTYIVQRMASMAALFYIISIYLYIRFRLTRRLWERAFYLCGCVAGFVLALGSKENAATLPFAVLLIEIVCFRSLNTALIRRKLFWGSIAGGVALLLLSSWVLIPGDMFSFMQGYDGRPFTLGQRLLTQPRIVLFYLSQLFYPIPPRLSIEHDVVVSTSLLHPWTTLPAIVLTLLLIGIGLWQIRRRPLLALGLLFFFLNHAIESSIIPLELLFEHRNYLPSLFLFLPVAAGMKWLLEHYETSKTATRPLLLGFTVLLITSFAWGTYVRNFAWKTEKTLWEDALRKAPNSARSHQGLAWAHYAKIGDYEEAIRLYERSLQLRMNNRFQEAFTLNNLALLYLQKKDQQRATALWEKAIALAPNMMVIRHRYVIGLLEMKRFEDALIHIDRLIDRYPSNPGYNHLKGIALLNEKKYRGALQSFNKCLNVKPRWGQALLGAGICHYFLKEYDKTEMKFRQALKTGMQPELTLLWLVETNLKTDDFSEAELYLAKLHEMIAFEDLMGMLQSNQQKDFLPQESKRILERKISRFYGQNKLSGLGSITVKKW